MNIGWSGMFTFKCKRELEMKANQNGLQPLYYFKSPPSNLNFLHENVFLYFHVITEEPCQHVCSDFCQSKPQIHQKNGHLFAGLMLEPHTCHFIMQLTGLNRRQRQKVTQFPIWPPAAS